MPHQPYELLIKKEIFLGETLLDGWF